MKRRKTNKTKASNPVSTKPPEEKPQPSDMAGALTSLGVLPARDLKKILGCG